MIEIYSFGYLHPVIGRPDFDVTVDIRHRLRDPHVDPAFRQLTGLDERVRVKVLTTPGALVLVQSIASLAQAMCVDGRGLSIGIGCAGGRHRSVVIADAVALLLEAARVSHLDVGKPVVSRVREPLAPS